jgi:hypothetical protein
MRPKNSRRICTPFDAGQECRGGAIGVNQFYTDHHVILSVKRVILSRACEAKNLGRDSQPRSFGVAPQDDW